MGPHENKTFMHRKSHHLSEEEKYLACIHLNEGNYLKYQKNRKRLNTKETNSAVKNGTWNQRRVSKSRSKMNTKYFYKDCF